MNLKSTFKDSDGNGANNFPKWKKGGVTRTKEVLSQNSQLDSQILFPSSSGTKFPPSSRRRVSAFYPFILTKVICLLKHNSLSVCRWAVQKVSWIAGKISPHIGMHFLSLSKPNMHKKSHQVTAKNCGWLFEQTKHE